MSASTRKALVPSLAAYLALATPDVALGQSVSTRPASVALTVIVPPRVGSELTMTDRATILRRTESTLDVQTLVGIANHPAARIEVRLGAGWSTESTRVLVRGRSGGFEPLATDAAVVAASIPASRTDARSRLQFRVESERAMQSLVSIPVEYRVTVGAGDQIAVWTFPALLEVADKP